MPATRRWTVDDVRALADASTDGARYELIDGVLLVTPAPRWVHQFVARELLRRLQESVEQHHIGEVLMAPAEIELDPAAIHQPDLFVAPCTPRGADAESILLLVVEVISPSSARTDRGIKGEFYLTHRVAEYWVVHGAARRIEVYRDGVADARMYADVLVWHAQDGTALTIDLHDLFARVDAAVAAAGWLEPGTPLSVSADESPRMHLPRHTRLRRIA